MIVGEVSNGQVTLTKTKQRYGRIKQHHNPNELSRYLQSISPKHIPSSQKLIELSPKLNTYLMAKQVSTDIRNF